MEALRHSLASTSSHLVACRLCPSPPPPPRIASLSSGTPNSSSHEGPVPTLAISAMHTTTPKDRGVLGLLRGSKNRPPPPGCRCGSRFRRTGGFSGGGAEGDKSMVLGALT
uniref:Uncharacterized protein n=1 Tax=Oryza glumipatula TaxID=40148 RepID=A0A0D9YX24_9ORYZ